MSTQQVIDSVWEAGQSLLEHGNCVFEWMELVHAPIDEVDRIYIEHETQGGG